MSGDVPMVPGNTNSGGGEVRERDRQNQYGRSPVRTSTDTSENEEPVRV